jgi:large subunit ribosomal protein L20
MVRVKKGVNALKSRKNILRRAKGFRNRRSTNEAAANEALMHAGAYAFAHRRDKKGVMRRMFNTRLNAALRPEGTTYSKFIGALKKKNVELDRKVLSEIANTNPEAFKKIIAFVK